MRALIAKGSLRADKVGGRWLVHWDSVLDRRRLPVASGRPMAPSNAWALLLQASGEELPDRFDAHTRWRICRTLSHDRLPALRGRLDNRARVHHYWALAGELRHLRSDEALVHTGSSAAGALNLGLMAPNAVDAYVRADAVGRLVHDDGLEDAPASQANVTLRAVPGDAWLLADRRVAPTAAIGLDLASYPDSRSARIGAELLARLDGHHDDAP